MTTRIYSLIIDHVIMSFIITIIMFPFFLIDFGNMVSEKDIVTCLYSSLTFSVYFNKDIFGQSIAKKIFKLYIKDKQTAKPASSFKCFVRNLFGIIWPIDLLVLLINKKQRLGDIVCNTIVEERTENIVLNNNKKSILITFIISTFLLFILFYFSLPILNNIE